MGLFNKRISDTSLPSEKEVKRMLDLGTKAYQEKNYQLAINYITEYFEKKGNGRFPFLDKNDDVMLLNLGNAKQYCNDFTGAIAIFNRIISIDSTWDAPYLMKSICEYKLERIEEAKRDWEIAAKLGNEVAQKSFKETVKLFR